MEDEANRVDACVASAAIPAGLSEFPPHVHEQHVVDETIGLKTPEQLLTPENSRSETSSNNENASNEEKPTLRRTSTRATRASLRSATQLETPETESNDTPAAAMDEAPVNGVPEGKRSQSSHLRHSIAVMEPSLWDEQGDARMTTESDKYHFAPDTPISESSQELQPGELNTSLQEYQQPRTLRKRVGRMSTNDTTPDKKSTEANDDGQSVRRSSRLSILDKASGLLDRAGSVLGKRTRGAERESDRRSSLRSRNATAVKEEPLATSNEPPAAKKRRVSEGDLPSKKSQQEESKQEEEPTPAPAPRYRQKKWLAHGLYSGQEPEGPRPVQKKNKTSRRRSRMDAPRNLLPMPLFAGERLLQNGRDFQLPFDIFSPLPPGQPKPNEWRKTNKNVFVGEAGSIWRANKDMELSQCLCIPETGCDENCQNRYMFYECDKGNCRLGPDCGNRSFEELKHRAKAGGKYNVGVEVIKTADRGYGVRSNRTFEPNQVIVEYTGEIITQSECEKRMRTIYKKNDCYYLMYFDQNMIIDATRGSIARFVNHSCEPNCRMEKWTVAGKPRMALFAGDRGVMTGEELTYDYNFDPYSQKNVQQCRCGSSECRGVLGPRPREKEQRSRERETKTDSNKPSKYCPKKYLKSSMAKRKIGGEIDESTSRLNKKRKVVKSGVKKAVSKARASVTKSAATRKKEPATKQRKTKETTKTTKVTKAKASAKTNAKPKDVKVPKVKSKAKVKTTVKATTSTKAKPTSAKSKAQASKTTSKAPSKLSRPSAATKAKILRAAQGTGARRRLTEKDEPKAQPKKRGRKPKAQNLAKVEEIPPPKKRGRPSKKK